MPLNISANYKLMVKDQLKALASEKVPVVQQMSCEEARARVRKSPTPKPQTTREPPKGKGGELWQKFYNDAVKTKHPNPELMADSFLRAREKSLALEKARHLCQKIDKAPKQCEVAAPAAKKGGRTVPPPAFRCKATKMDGKQCEFKRNPDCGEFCSKHAVKL
jgi:hypothetical protein